MAELSAIEVKLGKTSPALVLDGDLALSPYGLLLAARLAQANAIWIPRSLWPLIDSDRIYNDDHSLLGSEGKIVAEALSDWHGAWQTNRLRGTFFWFGDHRHEGLLPSDADEFVHQRFEVALNALGAEDVSEQAARPFDWRSFAACEALAISAALSPLHAVILARKGSLSLLGSIAARNHIEFKQADGLPRGFVSSFAEHALNSLPPIMHGTLELIALHVFAPKAMLLPWGMGQSELWGENDPGFTTPFGDAPDPWARASIAWHRV